MRLFRKSILLSLATVGVALGVASLPRNHVTAMVLAIFELPSFALVMLVTSPWAASHTSERYVFYVADFLVYLCVWFVILKGLRLIRGKEE